MFTWLEAAMVRFHAPEAAQGRLQAHYATTYRLVLPLLLGFPIVVGAILWFCPMSDVLKCAVAAGLALVLFRALARLAQESRRAAGDVRGAALLDIVMCGGGFAVGAALAVIGLRGAAPLLGAAAAAAVCLVRTMPGDLARVRSGAFEPARARQYFVYGVPVAMSLILSQVVATTDRFLLAAFVGDASVGVYHVGYTLANRTLDVTFIWLSMAGGPAAIAALERGGKKALDIVARDQASLMMALALPAAVGLALTARPLADVMVGPALRDGAAHVTPWIAASGFFSGLTTYYFHSAFTLARRSRRLLAAMAVPAVANLALNLYLIPRFGLEGALWSTLASYVLGAAASFGLGRAVLALPIPWGAIGRAAAATAIMAAAVIALPSAGGFAELILKASVGAAVYASVAFCLDLCGVRLTRAGLYEPFRCRGRDVFRDRQAHGIGHEQHPMDVVVGQGDALAQAHQRVDHHEREHEQRALVGEHRPNGFADGGGVEHGPRGQSDHPKRDPLFQPAVVRVAGLEPEALGHPRHRSPDGLVGPDRVVAVSQ